MKLLKLFKRLVQEQQGNVLVLVAISMFMIIGFMAIAIDSGRMFLTKSHLQNGLDAAVLAGAQELMTSNSLADVKNVAIDIAKKNNITLTPLDITINTESNSIEVKKTIEQGLTFARVFGFDSTPIPAFARAKVGGELLKRKGVVPIGIGRKTQTLDGFEKDKEYTMNFEPGRGNKEEDSSVPENGNFGFLALGGSGGNTLLDNIKNGGQMEVSDINTYEWTKTGLSWGNVKAGFQYRIDQDKDENECKSYTTAHDGCDRVIIVPIVDSFEDANGKTLVKIIGFAAFWIDSPITGHSIKGKFIKTVTFGEFGNETGTGIDFGVYGVKLVQ
jgi:hypothetical protein